MKRKIYSVSDDPIDDVLADAILLVFDTLPRAEKLLVIATGVRNLDLINQHNEKKQTKTKSVEKVKKSDKSKTI